MNEKEVLGFKKLTKENWQMPDEINKYFKRINFATGEETEITGDDRAEILLKYELSTLVPIDVRRKFETARGAMLYGYYFYPLFALGVDQLFRVAESAITHKCLILGLTNKTSGYQKKLIKLKNHKQISEQEFREWDDLRVMRDNFTHSIIQNLFPHWNSVSYLKIITEKINNLFQN